MQLYTIFKSSQCYVCVCVCMCVCVSCTAVYSLTGFSLEEDEEAVERFILSVQKANRKCNNKIIASYSYIYTHTLF